MKFILTGTYSSFNKGDAAMQLSTADALRKRWPNADIVIATPFPHYDSDTYKAYRIIRSHRRRIIFSTFQLILAKLYGLLLRANIRFPFLLLTEELKEINTADAVIDLSGDTITEDYGPHVTYSHLLPLLNAQAVSTPAYICAQSMGPFKLTKSLVKSTLKKCVAVAAREKVTYDYLLSIGLPKSLLQLNSDMAFLLDPSDTKSTQAILSSEGITVNNKTMGVTVSNIIRNRFNATHDSDFDDVFADILDEAIEKYKLQILFIGHVTGPSQEKDDRIVAQKIRQKMRNKDKSAILMGNYTPGELKAVISRCSVFMGARMHSNIAALSTGVPILAMSYSHKTLGIMESFKMKDYVVDGSDIDKDQVLNQLNTIIGDSTNISATLQEQLPKIKASSQDNIKLIESIVK